MDGYRRRFGARARIELGEDGTDVVIVVGKKNRIERLPLAGIKRAHLEVEF